MTGICRLAHRHEPERPRRALDGTHVCRGCAADLHRILAGADRFTGNVRDRIASIGELWLELAEILPAGSQGSGVAVSGSRERALPFQPLVSSHMHTIRDQLCAWAVQHCDERTETGPRNADPTTVAPWLAARLEVWAIRQEWIGDYADELRQMRSRALSLLDPVRRTRFPVAWCVGGPDDDTACPCSCHHPDEPRRPCSRTMPAGCGVLHPEPCPGALIADLTYTDDGFKDVACDTCATVWIPRLWIDLGLKDRARRGARPDQNGAA